MTEGSFLADHIEVLQRRRRERTPEIWSVSQIEIELSGSNSEAIFSGCRDVVLRWISSKSGALPDGAWQGEAFQLEDVGAQFAAAVRIENPKYWAARLDDADMEVARRTWVSEIGIAPIDGHRVLLGARLLCVSRGETPSVVPSIPGFVKDVAGKYEILLDGRVINDDPWVVRTRDDVDELVEFLSSSQRRHDVIVFALPEGSVNISETVFPPAWIRQRLFGAAHLVIITGPASYFLSDKVGKEFSVFRQAIRTYRRGLNFESDEPFNHPLALPDRVLSWGQSGAGAFANFLATQALRTTLLDRERESRLPPFTQVRQIATRIDLEGASKGGAEASDLLALALAENSQLRTQLDEQKETYDGLLVTANEESEQARGQADQINALNISLLARINHLESIVSTKGSEHVEIPETFDQLEVWAQRYLAGTVFVHNRAIRAAKKSAFENVPLAYKALLILRDHYVPMRRAGGGGMDKKRAFETACRELGLEEVPTFATARYGEEGDAYWIEYAGERHLLDHHLKGSSSRNERYGFRLYYCWHDGNQQVIVGWLPSHLPTRIT